MRIGEFANLAGISTRAVRHYHHIGLLPEPVRRSNGYRVYELRDAVRLVRVRRLTELGLSLEEVADVLSDDAGKELHDVLAELDADLARQQEQIRQRRVRLGELLSRSEEGPPLEGPVTNELAAFLREMNRTAAQWEGPEPETAVKDRELLALLDGAGESDPGRWLSMLVKSVSADPTGLRRAYELYARLDELVEASPQDRRVAEVARAIVDFLPQEVTDAISASLRETPFNAEGGFAEALFANHAPAQTETIRQAIQLLQGRGQ